MHKWRNTAEVAAREQLRIVQIACDIMGGIGLWEVLRRVPSDINLIRRGGLCRIGTLLCLYCRYTSFVRIVIMLVYWIALDVHLYQTLNYVSQALSIVSISSAFQILTFRVSALCGGYILGLVTVLQASLHVLAVAAISQITGAWLNTSFKLTLVIQLIAQSLLALVAGFYAVIRDRRHATVQQLLHGAGTDYPHLDLLYFFHRCGFLYLTLVFLFWLLTLVLQLTISDPTHHFREITGFAAYIVTVVSAWRVAEDLGPDLDTFPVTFTIIISAFTARMRKSMASSDGSWGFWRRGPNQAPTTPEAIEMAVVIHSSDMPPDASRTPSSQPG